MFLPAGGQGCEGEDGGHPVQGVSESGDVAEDLAHPPALGQDGHQVDADPKHRREQLVQGQVEDQDVEGAP